MPSRRTLLLFFVLVGIIYGLLLIPWPGVLTGYRKAFAAAGNIFFRTIGSVLITFEPMDAPTLDKDTEVTLRNQATGAQGILQLNARRLYLPTAFTTSLILAAPIGWRRKLAAVAMGLALISVYLGFTVWLKLVFAISEPRGLAAISLGPFVRKSIMILITILSKSPVTSYIVSLLVFVLTTVRREDVVRFGSTAIRQGTIRPGHEPA